MLTEGINVDLLVDEREKNTTTTQHYHASTSNGLARALMERL